MATKEVLTLYRDDPSSGIATAKEIQTGDTYLLSHDAEWTTGVNTSNVADGASAVAFTLNTASAYTSNNGHKFLSIQNNSDEILAISKGTATSSVGTALSVPSAIVFRPNGGTSYDLEYIGVFGAGVFNARATGGGAFYSHVTNGATAKGWQFTAANNLTTSGAVTARFAHNNGASGIVDITKDGSVKAAGGLGLWGSTANLTAQYSTTGTATGFTAGGTAVGHTSTFTGNSGTKAYTIGDIVLALKNNGIMAAS